MAGAFSKDRLAPMLRDTPALRGLVKDARARDSGNTSCTSTFPGGHITMTGANWPANLASRPIRIVLCDEIDRYPESRRHRRRSGRPGDEAHGDLLESQAGADQYPDHQGPLADRASLPASDQRRYWVPCPDCGEFQVLKWANVKWDEGKPETAHYVCEHCGSCIDEQHKTAMLQAGEWRADAAFKGTAGFHLNELYSPWRRWSEMASDFLEAKHAGTEMLKAWVNTSLGETWEEQGDKVESDRHHGPRRTVRPGRAGGPVRDRGRRRAEGPPRGLLRRLGHG